MTVATVVCVWRVTELLLDTIFPSVYVEGREGQKKARGEYLLFL